jgi:hypothetical protein
MDVFRLCVRMPGRYERGGRLMTTPLNVVVRGLFATPVAALEVPDAAARNAEVKRMILDRGAKTPSVQASNAGGSHSDREFPAWGGQHVTEILDYRCELANRITADRAGKPVRPAWKTSIWANVNAQGDANMCHYHVGRPLVRNLSRG